MKDLNLIPKSYIQEKKNKARRMQIIIAGTVAFALLVFSIILPILYTYSLTQQRNLLEATVKSGSGYALTLGQLSLIKNLYSEREAEGEKVGNRNNTLSRIISQVEKATPKKLFIINFSYSAGKMTGKDQLTMVGNCDTEYEVATFINQLRAEHSFKNVVLNTLKSNEIKESQKAESVVFYSFDITIYIDNQDVVK